MVARAVRHVHALALALLLAAALSGCADDLGSVAQQAGIAMSAIVRLDERLAVAARSDAGGGVEVLALTADGEDGWTAEIIAGDTDGDENGPVSADFVSLGGDTGDDWNAFLFGTAAGGASRVVVDGVNAAGGQVADGAWVLAFRSGDLQPQQLHWKVLDATGALMASGTGVTP